jgi:hypothetical protein
LEAISKEKLKLEAFKTWKALDDDELKRCKTALPIVLILTRKRCGLHKARAVALGNLYCPTGHLDVFAPVISQPGNRYLLIDAAANKDFLKLFDVDNAFVQSLIDSEIFVRLPQVWREENDDGIRKLVKALYGLPQSPRLWAKHYEKRLVELGWEQSTEKGLWRKISRIMAKRYLKLGVYVDDNTATGPDKQELDDEVAKILKTFPGKFIEPDRKPNGWVVYDQLGVDLWYRQSHGELHFLMEKYIGKVAEKFQMTGCRKADNPCFDESLLYDEKSPVVSFPIREAIGCLQWAATVCRVDICTPTNVLSRVAGKPCTKNIVACAKKVLRYLITHPSIGLFYSAENELKFNRIYKSLLDEGQRVKQWNLFTDASFANCFVTLKSTSGCVMYYRGCPLAWKSSRQTVRTNSTFESEFVAASDGLVLSETLTFKGFFEQNAEEEDLWIDNQTAVTVARTDTDAQRPRSRHVALRYYRVKDACNQIRFCPTEHQKADVLTKVSVSKEIGDNVFYHNENMRNPRKANKCIDSIDSDLDEMYTSCSSFLFDFSYLEKGFLLCDA